MSLFRLGRNVVAVYAAAILAACAQPSAFDPLGGAQGTTSGLAPLLGPPGLMPSITPHPDHRKSWMSPDAKAIKKLLYISDGQGTNDVYVYDYMSGKAEGTLTGFNDPLGQCVDSKGDVWIANYLGLSAEEFAHGGTTPIATLSTVGYPFGCSVDPTTGNVAVVSEPASSHGLAVVQIWHKGSEVFEGSNSACTYLSMPGYDNKGNLYAECAPFFGSIGVVEVPAGGTSLNNVSFNGVLYNWQNSVMWDGRYITLSNAHNGSSSGATTIFQATENASGGLVAVNETVLTDTCSDFEYTAQPFIVGSRNTPANKKQGVAVVGGNTYCSNRFNYWAYPAGGNPSSSLSSAPPDAYGDSVSIATTPRR